MTCPTCHQPMPDGALLCAGCVQRRSSAGLRARQIEALRQIAAGDRQLPTRAVDGTRHVARIGEERTFCGLPYSPQHRRNTVALEELSVICAGCRIEIHRLLDEAGIPR